MEKLSLTDQALFKLETSGLSPLYMCGATIVDPTDSPFPLDAKLLANHFAACMEEIPLMRQKMVQDPMKLSDLRLVDDPNFNVRDHMTVTTLEAPGGYDELTECLGVFSAQRMDLSKPLWRVQVIDGLEGGKLAVAMHLHHSIIDGEGSKRALAGVWGAKPTKAKKPQEKVWSTEEEPSSFSLLKGAILETTRRLYVQAPALMLKSVGPIVQMAADQFKKGSEALEESATHEVPKVKMTSLNARRLSDKRAVSCADLPLAEIKQLRKDYGVSVNDVAMVLASHALQYYFDNIGEDVDFDLVCGMPISMRAEGDTSSGNKVGAARVNLYNASVKGIDKQLAAINADTTMIKSNTNRARSESNASDDGAGLDLSELSELFSPIILDGLFYAVLKFNLLEKIPIANLMITNVPGVPGELYMAGAQLDSNIPIGPVVDGLGLTVCVTSSDQHLSLGFHGCGEAIQDKELFVKGVHDGFEELKRLAKK